MYVSSFARRLDSLPEEVQGAEASSDASAGFHAASTPLPDGFWPDIAVLSQRLKSAADRGSKIELPPDDVARLTLALSHADELRLPPDVHPLLRAWLQRLPFVPFDAARQGSSTQSTQPNMVVQSQRLVGLSKLLMDVLVTHSRPLRGEWAPLAPADEQHLRNLGLWMQDTHNAGRVERSHVGRQLLFQAAELITQCHFGNDQRPPVLPDFELLHELTAPRTQVHVTLPGPLDDAVELESAFTALPLWTWRVAGFNTLEWLVNLRPPHLHTLDLETFSGPMDAEVHELIRRACTEIPNLASLRMATALPDTVLGEEWYASPHQGGVTYDRATVPDGLGLLDAAVRSWEGQVLSTRMAIRAKASHPDAACLLALADDLGFKKSRTLGHQVLTMLRRAAANDQDMHDYAEAVRAERLKGTLLVELMATVHRKMTEKSSTAAVLTRADRPTAQPPARPMAQTGAARPSVQPPAIQPVIQPAIHPITARSSTQTPAVRPRDVRLTVPRTPTSSTATVFAGAPSWLKIHSDSSDSASDSDSDSHITLLGSDASFLSTRSANSNASFDSRLSGHTGASAHSGASATSKGSVHSEASDLSKAFVNSKASANSKVSSTTEKASVVQVALPARAEARPSLTRQGETTLKPPVMPKPVKAPQPTPLPEDFKRSQHGPVGEWERVTRL